MCTYYLAGVAALALLAVGLTLAGPACARVAHGSYANRAQSLLVADAEGSGADRRSGAHVAMVAKASYANRDKSLLVAEADGSGADVHPITAG